MSQIRNITIEGFRSIKSIRDLELRPLNVLIGANGSGKSNLLGAIELMRVAVSISDTVNTYTARAGGASRLLHFGPKVTKEINFATNFSDGTGGFEVEFFAVPPDWLNHRVLTDSLMPPEKFEGSVDPTEYGHEYAYLASTVANWIQYQFHDTGFSSPMKTTADLHDNRELRADGSNLAAFLHLLCKKYPQSYNSILSAVKQANPFIEEFILQPQKLNDQMIRLEWRQKDSDAYFDVYSFSDGTLRFIALATLLLQPESLRPSLILLDEPELGLHPYAIHLLAAMLDQASLDSQIIVATQSPILLDHFSPEDVLVAERVSGATEFHRLDGNRLQEWLKDYSLGQLWEQNEFGGQPLPEFRDGKDHR